jgi:hypothetical protein
MLRPHNLRERVAFFAGFGALLSLLLSFCFIKPPTIWDNV